MRLGIFAGSQTQIYIYLFKISFENTVYLNTETAIGLMMKQALLSAKALLRILVIDDHESVLGGTIDVLRKQYPDAEFITALTGKNALSQLTSSQTDLVVMDLSIPDSLGVTARPNTGLQLLKNLMKDYPNLNIVVQSAHVRTLVRG